MPYSGKDDPDLPSNVKKMGDKDKKQWVDVFNSAYASCTKDNGKKADCEKSAFAQANGVLKKKKDGIFSDIFRRLLGGREITSEDLSTKNLLEQERALSLSDMWSQLSVQAMQMDDWAWLVNTFIDTNNVMFSILAAQGKLYKAAVSIDAKTNTATLSGRDMWEEVKEEFIPVTQSRFLIQRQIDESYRWFLIAGTTVLNRNGQIDSSKLFDKFVRNADEDKQYPYLTFHHLGKKFKMGEADWLARDGIAFIASGLFDMSTKVAQKMVDAYVADPEYWGSSVGFWSKSPTQLKITQDISIPVYSDDKSSWCEEISILPEEQACALLTALRSTKEVEKSMNKQLEEAIRKLAGEDEEAAKEFIAMVDGVNRTAQEEGMIHRAADTPIADTTPATPATPAPPATEEKPSVNQPPADQINTDPEAEPTDGLEVPVLERSIELDESTMQGISDLVLANPTLTAIFKATQDALKASTDAVAALTKQINDIHSSQMQSVKTLQEKVDSLGRTDEQKKNDWEKDISLRTIERVRVTHRPRQPESSSESISFAEVASATLANLK